MKLFRIFMDQTLILQNSLAHRKILVISFNFILFSLRGAFKVLQIVTLIDLYFVAFYTSKTFSNGLLKVPLL